MIAWAPDRESALTKLVTALGDTAVLGVGTNVAFLRALLADPDVVAGRLDTGLVERRLDDLVATTVPDTAFMVAGLDALLALQPRGPRVDPWDLATGWRLGGAAGTTFRLTCGGREATVRVTGSPDDAWVTLDDGEPVRASARRTGKRGLYLEATVAGRRTQYRRVLDGDTLWLSSAAGTWAVHEHSMLESESAAASVSGTVTSPMPGTVLVVKATAGDDVKAGAPLVVVEAMKMEHTVTAPVDGVLTELHVRAGQQVALNQPLAVVTPQEEL